MATQAQIDANRRNAAKSTGPRTAQGKATSSKNARTHGMTSALDEDAVLAYFEALSGFLADADTSPEVISRAAGLAFCLARAEVNMAQVRKGASEVVARGDDYLRLHPEIEMTRELLEDNGMLFEPLTNRERDQGIRLIFRLSRAGRKSSAWTYRRQLRYLRTAERWHEKALEDWLQCIEASAKASKVPREQGQTE